MYPTDYGFSFGVVIADLYGRPLALDPTYFKLEFSEGTFIKKGNFYFPNYNDLGYKLWDSVDMPGVSDEYIKRGLGSSMYCPVRKNYRVGGNYLAPNFHYVSIILKRCFGTGCQPAPVIDAALKQITISFIYVNSY